MSEKRPHNFHLRLPRDMQSALEEEKGENSLNKEILARLRSTMSRDDADKIASALRPLLSRLDEDDRAELVALTIRALHIFARSGK